MSDAGSPPTSPVRAAAVAALAYTALAVALTWPLALHLTDHLPTGDNPTSLPASAGAWALWWVSDRLRHGGWGWWDAPIFHPAHDAFGYSETTIPLGLVAAPLFWLGGSPALASNLVVLGSLVLNGLAGRALALTLRADGVSAGLAGAFVVGAPLILRWLAVLPMVPLFGLLMSCRAVLLLARDPRAGTAVGLGGWLAVTWLLSLQYGLFAVLVGPVLLLAVPVDRTRARALAGAAVVAAAVLAPVLIPQHRILRNGDMERPAERAEKGGVALAALGRPLVKPRLPIPGPRTGIGIWPGTVLLGLAAVGLADRRRDREVVALAVAAGVAVGCAVLPTLEVGGHRPYEWMRTVVPGLERIREPRRAMAIETSLLPVLAALGLDRVRRGLPGAAGVATATALVALALANDWPKPQHLQATPDGHAPLAGALRDRVPPDGVVAFLPYDDGSATPEADRMVLQAAHGRRMVNGYSSYYPKSYWALRRVLHPRPKPAAWERLAEVGVTHLVAPPGWLPADAPVEVVWTGPEAVIVRLVP